MSLLKIFEKEMCPSWFPNTVPSFSVCGSQTFLCKTAQIGWKLGHSETWACFHLNRPTAALVECLQVIEPTWSLYWRIPSPQHDTTHSHISLRGWSIQCFGMLAVKLETQFHLPQTNCNNDFLWLSSFPSPVNTRFVECTNITYDDMDLCNSFSYQALPGGISD